MKKRKLILFIDSLAGGGAQRQMVTLANNLDKNKYDIVLLVYHPIWHYREALDLDNVRLEIIEKKSKFDLTFIFKLVNFFRAEKPDLILSYLNTANLWARLAGRIAGVDNIVTSERNIDIVHSSLRVRLEKLLYRFSKVIVVNASATQELLTNQLGLPTNKIKIIYNGVDVNQFEPATVDQVNDLKNELDIASNDIVFTLPGRLSKQKNHLCLLKSLAHPDLINKNIKVLFVGEEIDNDLALSYKQFVADNGLDHLVKFLAKRNDMNVIYAASDAVILPSLWEGFPNVVLESLLLSTPVIASDVADNAKLVINGQTGFLFESDNDNQLSQSLLDFIAMSKDARATMGVNGFSHIKNNFSKEKLIANYESLFDDLFDT